MSEFSGQDRPCLARGTRLQWDEARQRHMLLYPEGALALNGTAAAILELCDGEHTLASIVATLQARYPGAAIDEDVRDLLARIGETGLVHAAR